MIVETVYLKGVHRYSYRPGDIGKINRLCNVEPSSVGGIKNAKRLCYEVIYRDATIDFVSLSDVADGSYVYVNEKGFEI